MTDREFENFEFFCKKYGAKGTVFYNPEKENVFFEISNLKLTLEDFRFLFEDKIEKVKNNLTK